MRTFEKAAFRPWRMARGDMLRRNIRLILAIAAGILLAGAHVPAVSQEASAPGSGNPLSAFVGDWTLKDDRFQQVWDGTTIETLTITKHFTHCDRINTDGSVLCVVSAGDLKGHILWTMGAGNRVHHLSHFGTERTGVGLGTLDESSNLALRIGFRDEPEGTYREYEYTWVSADEYTMMSRQYDRHAKQPAIGMAAPSFGYRASSAISIRLRRLGAARADD